MDCAGWLGSCPGEDHATTETYRAKVPAAAYDLPIVSSQMSPSFQSPRAETQKGYNAWPLNDPTQLGELHGGLLFSYEVRPGQPERFCPGRAWRKLTSSLFALPSVLQWVAVPETDERLRGMDSVDWHG